MGYTELIGFEEFSGLLQGLFIVSQLFATFYQARRNCSQQLTFVSSELFTVVKEA